MKETQKELEKVAILMRLQGLPLWVLKSIEKSAIALQERQKKIRELKINYTKC